MVTKQYTHTYIVTQILDYHTVIHFIYLFIYKTCRIRQANPPTHSIMGWNNFIDLKEDRNMEEQ